MEDSNDRKMFVGGLPQEVSDSDLQEHFANFGAISEVKLMKDQVTGNSKGFAFITFESVESMESAVSGAPHTIQGKEVTAKKAKGKQGQVYIGKIPEDGGPTEDQIKEALGEFGTIVGQTLRFAVTESMKLAHSIIKYSTSLSFFYVFFLHSYLYCLVAILFSLFFPFIASSFLWFFLSLYLLNPSYLPYTLCFFPSILAYWFTSDPTNKDTSLKLAPILGFACLGCLLSFLASKYFIGVGALFCCYVAFSSKK